jgi:hypothetical protein
VSGILNDVVLQVDIDFIGTIIGIIIGASATYCSAYLIENRREKNERRKEKQFRKRIASIVGQELDTYVKFRHSTRLFSTRVN